ncbi:hypothetical protein B9Z55_025392 [Caenorhabditis nigoni]|nr:hypothetical protein B9Z55_025392 [Caenorhabditis nigoni]
MRCEIPPTSPKPVEGVCDLQRRLWAACRCMNKRIYRNGIPMFGWLFLCNMANGGIAMSVMKCPIDGFRFYMKKFEGSQKDARQSVTPGKSVPPPHGSVFNIHVHQEIIENIAEYENCVSAYLFSRDT